MNEGKNKLSRLLLEIVQLVRENDPEKTGIGSTENGARVLISGLTLEINFGLEFYRKTAMQCPKNFKESCFFE